MAQAYFKENATGYVLTTSSPDTWARDKNYTKLSATEGAKAAKAQALAKLHEILKPRDTVYTILRHVSGSGMSRCIDAYVFRDNEPVLLSGWIEDVLSYKRHATKQGLVVNGAGMDMGFHLIYALGRAMWPDGTPEPHGRRNGEPDREGGYALKQTWL